jgi:hypothetical protein
VSAHELNNSKPEEAANVGGAGLGWMDEQRLKEKAEREDAEITADKAKARRGAPQQPARARTAVHSAVACAQPRHLSPAAPRAARMPPARKP